MWTRVNKAETMRVSRPSGWMDVGKPGAKQEAAMTLTPRLGAQATGWKVVQPTKVGR